MKTDEREKRIEKWRRSALSCVPSHGHVTNADLFRVLTLVEIDKAVALMHERVEVPEDVADWARLYVSATCVRTRSTYKAARFIASLLPQEPAKQSTLEDRVAALEARLDAKEAGRE